MVTVHVRPVALRYNKLIHIPHVILVVCLKLLVVLLIRDAWMLAVPQIFLVFVRFRDTSQFHLPETEVGVVVFDLRIDTSVLPSGPTQKFGVVMKAQTPAPSVHTGSL